jgi:hypothetical protein
MRWVVDIAFVGMNRNMSTGFGTETEVKEIT